MTWSAWATTPCPHHYRGDDGPTEQYDALLADLRTRLPEHADILDVGCGCGIPVARFLSTAGHRVTVVDIGDVQIERARRLVPDATFIRAPHSYVFRTAPSTL